MAYSPPNSESVTAGTITLCPPRGAGSGGDRQTSSTANNPRQKWDSDPKCLAKDDPKKSQASRATPDSENTGSERLMGV